MRLALALLLLLGCGSKKAAAPPAHDAGAPAGLAPPADGTTRLTLDRLVLDVGGAWELAQKADGGDVMLTAAPAGVTDAMVLVMPSVDLGGASLADALVRGVDASTRDRTVVKEMEVQLGASKTGVPFAAKVRVTRGAGGDVLDAMYYMFDVGGRGQVVALLATTPASFAQLAALLAPAIETIHVVAPAAAPTATLDGPSGARPGELVIGAGSTGYVAEVGTSPTLSPVKFRVAWVQPHRRSSAYAARGFHYTRDGAGNAYVYDDSTYDTTQQATVVQYLAGRSTPQATKIDHRTVSELVSTLTGYRVALPGGYDGGPPSIHFDTLAADRAGNLFVGGPASVEESYNTHGEYFVWRADTRQPEAVVTHPLLQGLARAPGWGTTSAFRPTPDGDAWMFVITDGWPRVLYFTRGADGWGHRELDVSRFAGAAPGPSPTFTTLDSFGAADARGGWVFYSNGAFWRISRDGGPIQPVLRMELPSKGVTVSGPVVLDNGDLWFAALADDSVVTYVGPDAWGHGTPAVKHQSIVLGDRSRWIRARLDGKGGVALGEIAAEDLLAALAAAGASISGGVLETPQLELDLATGGILTYDSHHGVLFAVQPLD